MTDTRLDCRGLACPGPVIKTKECLDQGDVAQLTVLVDNAAAQENVSRFLERCGYRTQFSIEEGYFAVSGLRQELPQGQESPLLQACQAEAAPRKTLILLATDRLGRGDDMLGQRLVVNFIATLKEMGPELWRLVLVNAGVKLAVAGSEVLASLQALEQAGVRLMVCGTCLNHFQILEHKQVVETTNMLDIVTAMQLADKVISLT